MQVVETAVSKRGKSNFFSSEVRRSQFTKLWFDKLILFFCLSWFYLQGVKPESQVAGVFVCQQVCTFHKFLFIILSNASVCL